MALIGDFGGRLSLNFADFFADWLSLSATPTEFCGSFIELVGCGENFALLLERDLSVSGENDFLESSSMMRFLSMSEVACFPLTFILPV